MNFIPAKTPLIVKKLWSKYIWDIPSKEKTIYLTFDDGPTTEVTHWTLNTLKAFNAKATFFCIGKNIQNHPEILKDIIDSGHAVGNHTQNHIKGWKTTTKDYLKNIEEAQIAIENKIYNTESSINKNAIKLFRPPYGQITQQQGKALMHSNYKIIMWDILSFDWNNNVSKEACYNNVISKANNGSIVVFHDSEKASKNMMYTLPKVLEFYQGKGYVFKTIPVDK